MIVGTAVFLAWSVFPAIWLGLAGLLVIIGSGVLVTMGFISLWLYARLAKRSDKPRRSVRRPAVLLLLNFPVCSLYLTVAVIVGSAGFFTIRNGLASPIDELTLVDVSGERITFNSIPPGAHTHCVGPFAEGPLRYAFSVGKDERTGMITEYVSGLERRFELEVGQGLQVSAQTETNLGSVPEYLRNCLFE